jgi:hypothetical protein
MNFFENSLVDLINLEEQLGSDFVDVQAGDQDCNTVIEKHLTELRDIIEEFRKHHSTLVYQDHLINKLAEVQL